MTPGLKDRARCLLRVMLFFCMAVVYADVKVRMNVWDQKRCLLKDVGHVAFFQGRIVKNLNFNSQLFGK